MNRKPITALESFMAYKTSIDVALARLQALSDEHFARKMDHIDWGDASDLGYISDKLKELTDFAFQEEDDQD